MTATKKLQIKDFTYPLPDERIAKYPLARRDDSKLLLYKDGEVSEDKFFNLPQYLKPGALMVFNNTRVIRARLHFKKQTGALIEVFCLEPHLPADYEQSFASRKGCAWICLVGNLKKWKEGELQSQVEIGGTTITLSASRGEECGTGHIIHFTWDDEAVSFAELLDAIGELPIPPYLHRATEERDLQTYQTVYGKIKGSVAAPTAGLHFTPEVLEAIRAKNISCDEVTLHVGAGTFKPVKAEEISGHEMHSEWISVKRSTIEALIKHGGECIAVGTTSVRTLESLYYIGVKIHQNPDIAQDDLHVEQWLPYDYATSCKNPLSTQEALQAILDYMGRNQLSALHTATQIIIAPGYDYHIVKTMVTNFHQPQSTLLLLVSAFVKGDWRKIYDYALAHDFRFLSYGDSSLLNF